jgi:GAF domain-containing protein
MNNSLGAFLRSMARESAGADAAIGWRASLVRLLLAGALVVGLLALVPAFAVGWGAWAAILAGAAYLVLGAVVVWRAPYLVQLVGLLLIIYALGLAELLTTGSPASAIFYFLISIVFATMIWSLIAGAAVSALTLLTLGTAALLLQLAGSPAALTVALADWIRSVIAIMLAAIAIIAGFQRLQLQFTESEQKVADAMTALQAERSSLAERIDARTVQWRAVLEVSRAASGIYDPGQLTDEVVNLISDRFGYYYAAIFLLDETGSKAELHSATGEAGRLLKENKHSLAVGGKSMVGAAISGREPRIALDTETEAVRFANPLLPYTRSEIAVPLIIGDRILGALDVQSTSPGAFGPAEVDTLLGMASQVAIAFENARLLQESRQSLEELQVIQRQYIATAWQPLADRGDMHYSLGEEEFSPGGARIDVPLSLRDQIIGEINLSSEADWTPEQRNLVEAIATQAALALENARLVESTQSTAQRERLLAEITTKVWSSSTREGVLRTAVSELAKALEAERAFVELAAEDGAQAAIAYEYTSSGVVPGARGSQQPRPGGLRQPLELRGQTLGTVVIDRGPGAVWTDADRDLAQKTAAQTSLALENVRLLEDTRQRALHEQSLSELSARLGESVDLDSLLQTAVRELASLPDVADATIVLNPGPSAEAQPLPDGTRE